MVEGTIETRHLVTIGDDEFSVKSCRSGSSYTSFELVMAKTGSKRRCNFTQPTNMVVVDSVQSGTGRTPANDFYAIVMEPVLSRLNVKHTIIKTMSRDSVSEFAEGLDVNEGHTVLFLSGDTSISEFFNSLPLSVSENAEKSNLCILPIPMGTGNAWASSLSHVNPIESFGSYIGGSLRLSSFPLYRALFPNNYSIVFFIIFSLGFHANLLHACEDPELKKIGTERFKMAAQKILQEYDLRLDISVGQFSNSYAYFAIINTTNLEQTYIPSPLSDPLKPELHILGYSSGLSTEKLTQEIMRGYQNKIGDGIGMTEGVTYRPLASNFDVVLDYPENSPAYKFEICCDGTLLNFSEQQLENAYSNKIQIEFLTCYSPFSLKVFH